MSAMKMKATLSSEKVIVLREMKISDYQKAAEITGTKVQGQNQYAASIVMQNEILKALLEQVNDRTLSASEKEDLDSLFTHAEYQETIQVIQEFLGEVKAPKVEMLTSGDK